jgi:hypothetical protein
MIASKKQKIEKKRQKEQYIVGEMTALFCRKQHIDFKKGQLCPVCQTLVDYASARSKHCPFIEQKTFCSNCRVHCYRPDMQKQIQTVMRFSGPRILLHHPILTVWHLLCSLKEKRRN